MLFTKSSASTYICVGLFCAFASELSANISQSGDIDLKESVLEEQKTQEKRSLLTANETGMQNANLEEYEEECYCGYGTESCKLDIQFRKICHCKPGYGSKDGFCKDCDCGKEEHRCEFDILGARSCDCKLGYGIKLDGRCTACNCSAFGANMSCSFNSTNGEQTCHCATGYEYKDNSCIDINECLKADVCPPSTDCHNTEGSYTCSCKTGYGQYNDYDTKFYGCEEIDECLKINTCPHTDTTICTNLPGSYICSCRKGYSMKSNGLSPELSGCELVENSQKTPAIVIGVIVLSVIAVVVTIISYRKYRNRFSAQEPV